MTGRTLSNRLFLGGLRAVERAIRLVAGDKGYWKVIPRVLEELDVVYRVDSPAGPIRIHCGGEVARFRAETLFTKEPDTIRWIETFTADDVLLDVGANIGVYTVIAAVMRGARSIAVEPTAANIANLARNIRLNGIDSLVYPIMAAAHDTTGVSRLFMHSGGLVPGGSGASFDQPAIDSGEAMDVKAVQNLLGFALDDLVRLPGLPFPTHLKVDVIGTQDKVIAGATGLLADPRLKSAMIEIPDNDRDKSDFIMATMARAGFRHVPEMSVVEVNYFFVRS